VTTEELVAQTREVYAGPLVVGADLMTFKIGMTGVEIFPVNIKCLRCAGGALGRLVPISGKRRGLCPSCRGPE
jgi:hypothetical protein